MNVESKKALKDRSRIFAGKNYCASIAASLIAGFVLVISACSYTEGYAVDDYLKSAARIQYGSDSSLLGLSADLNALGDNDLAAVAATTERLKNEESEVASARDQLENLEAPEAASALKTDLVDLYSSGAENISLLVGSGDYRIAIEPLMSEYESASASFSNDIKGATDSTALIAQMQTYRAKLEEISEKLKPIEPSALSAHSHKRFQDNVSTLEAGLDETIAGLQTNDKTQLDEAAKKMSTLDAGSIGLQNMITAERQSDIKAFDAKIQRMSDLMAQVGQDQLELHREFDRQ